MRRITHNRRGLGDFDVWGIGFLLLVALAALVLGRKMIMEWMRTAGRAKYQFKIGEMEGRAELEKYQKSLNTATPPSPPSK